MNDSCIIGSLFGKDFPNFLCGLDISQYIKLIAHNPMNNIKLIMMANKLIHHLYTTLYPMSIGKYHE